MAAINRLFKAVLVSDYGSVFILALLCLYYGIVTLGPYHPVTPAAGRGVARQIIADHLQQVAQVVIVTRNTSEDRRFAGAVEAGLERAGAVVVERVAGQPSDVAQALERLAQRGASVTAVATNYYCSTWGPLRTERLQTLMGNDPSATPVRVYSPRSYLWPGFLAIDNLRNIINQNADIAILAIGMTMVIITAGIDLSVGSLLALSSVLTAMCIQTLGGAEASVATMVGCSLLGIAVCGLCGSFSGVMVTFFRVPAFIVTLSMMMIARGLALKTNAYYQKLITGAEGTPETLTIDAESFTWLARGELLGVPNPILLMFLLFLIAHVVMSRTSLGRYIYAVGGNEEAARLSGVPVRGTLILVYAICGAMAGLGGVVDASRFSGGRPIAGMLYELQVIAAVVVGGTSIAGGEGRVLGTLIGAMIIAVIQNGLNMSGVKPYEQQIVFGGLILAAVLLDQTKKRWWRG